MAADRVDTQIHCPACGTELTLPTRARYNGDGTATVAIDTTPIRQHVAEHQRE